MMSENKITIVVSTDENHVPTDMVWSAEGGDIKNRHAKALAIGMWDKEDRSTMNMELWTKDMSVDEMKMFVCDNMMTLANTLETATSDKGHAEAMRGFTRELAHRIGIVNDKEEETKETSKKS
jgi:gliding motility-associated protein GldC